MDAPMPLDFAVKRFFPHGGVTKHHMLAAIRAAINAWPGAEWRESGRYPHGIGGPDATVTTRLILPMPQEARDE